MFYPGARYQEGNTEWLQAKLKEVDWDIKRELVKALDHREGAWKELITVLPDWLLNVIHIPQIQNNNSPSWALIQTLEQWGFTVAQLIACLEVLGLENVIMILKPDEEIKIIEDLPNSVEVEAGGALQLYCNASGFPTPFYQWYKDDEELIEHLDRELSLPNASYAHGGTYYCKVYTIDRRTNKKRANPVVSNQCQVNVVEPFLPHSPSSLSTGRPPEIEFQPRGPGDLLALGCSFTLVCKGTGDEPIKYQWFRDHEELHGETNSELHLRHLMPDETTGMSMWQYVCLIKNPYGQVLSDSVKVALNLSSRDRFLTAKDKVALLIANESYEHMQSFTLPSSDVATLSKILRSLNFRVMSYVDLKHSEMINAVNLFCSELSKGSYGFFYFAGHGFEDQGQSYMQPVDASESFVYEENVCVDFVASNMQKSEPALNFILLDMCRERPTYNDESPVERKPPYIQQKKYKNIIFAFATSFLGEAIEIEGYSNGLFVQFLKRHLAEKKNICDILRATKHDMSIDPVACKLEQDPVISFNISEPRTLRDPILNPREQKLLYDEKWATIYTPPEGSDFKLGTFRFGVTFRPHKETFCNALDMHVQFKDSQNPSQPCDVDVVFSPACIVKVGGYCLEPGFLVYTVKGFQKLQVPAEYQIILQTSTEVLCSSKFSFSMAALESLTLTSNVF